MIALAANEAGWFKVRAIAAALEIDDSIVTETALAWESRGWLSAEKSNVGRPGKNGRAMLDALIAEAQREGLLPLLFKSPLEGQADDMGKRRKKVREKEAIIA